MINVLSIWNFYGGGASRRLGARDHRHADSTFAKNPVRPRNQINIPARLAFVTIDAAMLFVNAGSATGLGRVRERFRPEVKRMAAT
jgi:hypothetical protein